MSDELSEQAERIQTLVQRLDDPWKPIRNEAAQLLAAEGEAAVPFVKELLTGADHDPDKAHVALWILEQVDTEESRDLVEQYWDRFG